MPRKLDKIEISGFKSIREQTLDLKNLNILIGANGSGKSNLISLFKLLNEMVEGRFQAASGRTGAEALLYFGRKTTSELRIHLSFAPNEYECIWEPTESDRLQFRSERGAFHRSHFGSGTKWQYYGSGHTESKLPEIAKTTPIAEHIFNSMREWKVFHFHDTSDSARVKSRVSINDNFYLRGNAENLASFLYKLQNTHRQNYEAIRDMVRLVAPFFDDFVLRPVPENETQIQLEWKEFGHDRPLFAHQLSDGTLRFICLATVLLQPSPPATILIDEPELGLHPYAISVLASLMRSAATRSQIIATTQSITLLNEFTAEDVVVLNRRERETVFSRVEPNALEEWLKEYSLGELWQKNVIEGRPSR
jgi:predicted ATPase